MIGKYIRLSAQDDDCRPGEKLESNSVANQRTLLDHYIASHPDLSGQYALEFLDDGHTGTNFDRPGVQALFAAVKRGEVDCIIVKDLSRFGRDSVEMNEYLERCASSRSTTVWTARPGRMGWRATWMSVSEI